MLHSFTKRTAPTHLRRVQALRFNRPTGTHARDFRERALLTNRSAQSMRRRRLGAPANRSSYLSSQ
jgi:hypothetical protein